MMARTLSRARCLGLMTATMHGSVRAASTTAVRKEIVDRTDLGLGAPTIVIGPDDPDSLVVFMHGLGDTARGWEQLGDLLAPRFPSTRFIFPTAPSQPVTVNGGYVMPSWYDIIGFDSRDSETCAGIDASRTAVTTILEEQFSEEGSRLSPAVTVLGGFSQGGAVALWTGLQRTGADPLAGVLCMSGYLPQPQVFSPTPSAKKTPVLLLHGEADPVVRYSFATATEKALTSHGIEVGLKGYADMEHSANLEEIEDAAQFLKRVLDGAASKSKL
eukprot:m.81581 g.81581  ORF g.81581 m.81581 type:complete len:273 (+) comp9413_c0_seq2:61-879(+)